jgi:hypothetical protein
MASARETAARMWQADSVIALLGKLDLERLPPSEGRAVGEVQAKAVDDWLAAYIDLREDRPERPRDRRLQAIRTC